MEDGNIRAILAPAPSTSESRGKIEGRLNSNGEAKPRKPKKNRRPSAKRTVLVALAILAVIVGVKLTNDWWTVGRFIEGTDDAYVGGDVTIIAPKVPGFISLLAVADNQQVRKGDLLLRLDDRDYRAALARAEAAVALQQAGLANLEATRQLQEAMVAQSQAEISATDAEINRSHDDEVRYQNLVATGTESVQSFQKADADYKKALAAGEKAHAALSATQRQLEVIATEKQQVLASLDQAKADRDLAQLNLSYTELRAPIDGVVGNRSAQFGAYATTGSQLISLVPIHGLWIDANFKESQIAGMRPGSSATVKLDSIAGQTFHGHVVSIAPATGAQFSVLPPENATGNFTRIVQRLAVRIVLDDEMMTSAQLRPGLSVTATVDTRRDGKAGL
jgi:membrane fusion protein (multidrug efflux system)